MKCEICNCTEEETVKMYSNKSKFKITLCNKHYCQMRQRGKITDVSKSRRHEPQVCDICGKSEKVTQYTKSGEYNGYLLCVRHKSQVEYYGEILKRTKFDKNEIIKYDNHAEMILYDVKNKEVARTILDLEEVEKVSKLKWYYGKNGYVTSSNLSENTNLYLHRYILNVNNTELVVDHIDRDKLNNSKNNLRLVESWVNGINKDISKNNKSGVVGVYFNNLRKRWHSRININKKVIHLGYHVNFEDAVLARLLGELKYCQEHPPQKHLFKEYGIEVD